MNVVKFYHRDTGNMRPVRIVQGRPPTRGAKYQPLTFTEKAMAHAGYFRKRPKI
jgi:hypothetical protein